MKAILDFTAKTITIEGEATLKEVTDLFKKIDPTTKEWKLYGAYQYYSYTPPFSPFTGFGSTSTGISSHPHTLTSSGTFITNPLASAIISFLGSAEDEKNENKDTKGDESKDQLNS